MHCLYLYCRPYLGIDHMQCFTCHGSPTSINSLFALKRRWEVFCVHMEMMYTYMCDIHKCSMCVHCSICSETSLIQMLWQRKTLADFRACSVHKQDVSCLSRCPHFTVSWIRGSTVMCLHVRNLLKYCKFAGVLLHVYMYRCLLWIGSVLHRRWWQRRTTATTPHWPCRTNQPLSDSGVCMYMYAWLLVVSSWMQYHEGKRIITMWLKSRLNQLVLKICVSTLISIWVVLHWFVLQCKLQN